MSEPSQQDCHAVGVGDLTPHFSLSEFRSRDGAPMTPAVEANIRRLAVQLQRVRDRLGAPMRITSGYRSPEHNRRVGGAPRSLHVRGLAADIASPAGAPVVHATIRRAIRSGAVRDGGLGLYSSWVHYDLGPAGRRWRRARKGRR